MIKRFALASLLLFAVAAVPSIAAEDKPAAKNLLGDGSFEDIAVGALPAGANLFSSPENAYKAAAVEGGRTGKRSLLIEGEGSFGVLSLHRGELPSKFRFALNGYVKIEGDSETKATIKFDLFKASGEWIASSTAGDLTGEKKDWQLISVIDSFANYPEARSFTVAVALVGKGKARFDDVEFVALNAKDLPDNLLANGSFENVLGNKPGNIWIGAAEGGKVEALSSTDKPKDGKHCLQLKGDAEWAVATLEKAKIDPKKTYTVTGYVRVKSGAGQIKLDYFNGDEWLGSTFGEDAFPGDWQEQKVESELSSYSNATHIAATCVGTGEFEVFFDRVVLTGK
ncbi:MAG: hypothetical protein WD768_19335 [Phycisphaeraceae bacterium]